MGEFFTSGLSNSCATPAYLLDSLASEYPERLALIRYHTLLPLPGDRFYLANPEQNQARSEFYSYDFIPKLYLDGAIETGGFHYLEDLEDSLIAEMERDAPMEITLNFIETDSIEITISNEEPISSSDIRLFCAIVESGIDYEAPNGQKKFNQVMRHILPASEGEPVDISSITTLRRVFSYTLSTEWHWINLEFVAWVQDMDTKEILQAAKAALPTPEYYFSYNYEQSIMVIEPDSSAEFFSTLTNEGSSSEIFTVSISIDAPEGWIGSFCTEDGCYPFTAEITLAPAEVETITADIYPLGVPGTGRISMIISGSHFRIPDTTVFTAMSGLQVLVVDDDQGFDYEDYYTEALDNLDVSYGVIDHDQQPVTYNELKYFEAALWFTGNSYENTIVPEDEEALASFLGGGGRLFFCSCETGWELSFEGRTDFYSDYLHAEFIEDDALSDILHGVDGDLVSDALELDCSGGDGANNNEYPDVIAPVDEYASPIFYYHGGDSLCGGLKIETAEYRVVYLPFAYEAINNLDDRILLMRRILEWLGLETEILEGLPFQIPGLFTLKPNYPNPFNPFTTIEFYLNSTANEKISFEIFNLTGQKVRSYTWKSLKPGFHHLYWDGTDQEGQALPAGIYIGQLEYPGEKSRIKMILTK
ncbi:Omp28-related outer membrane protein [bacterium]|nr:Omp28-related outer membrane protein [bacterium]